jgi:hypothetical protein
MRITLIESIAKKNGCRVEQRPWFIRAKSATVEPDHRNGFFKRPAREYLP